MQKDRWEAAATAGETITARGLLGKAIDAYLRGFEADWRNAYPGVNAVTPMAVKDPTDARRTSLIPVVAYAVERRIAAGRPDYWDYATLVELGVRAPTRRRQSPPWVASAAVDSGIVGAPDDGAQPPPHP